MQNYTPYPTQTFTFPQLDGISQKQIDVHIGLYQGYVKNVNSIREQILDLTKQDPKKYQFAIESTRRRFGFEFNGMRMHELYFSQWEATPSAEPRGSALDEAVSVKWGSWDGFIDNFKKVGMSRGGGWCTFGWDAKEKKPHVWWTADHEIGMLADVRILLTMDMWEHAYMVDYAPAEKKQYIEAFFKNLNWSTVENRFAQA
jgi:Fe-Mn family superoxide dismutase